MLSWRLKMKTIKENPINRAHLYYYKYEYEINKNMKVHKMKIIKEWFTIKWKRTEKMIVGNCKWPCMIMKKYVLFY